MLISIVVPCFNEEEVLGETVERLFLTTAKIKANMDGALETSLIKRDSNQSKTIIAATGSLVGGGKREVSFELIFVNDGSKDKTLDILKNYAAKDTRVRIVNFSRNFGHQIAVTAGMDASNGDAVVLIDADLQDPPELISQMIELWQNGFEVVYATRTKRLGESFFKLFTAKSFYRILNLFSDTPIPLDTGDFRLMDRSVVDVLCRMPEHERFIRGMVSWVGFKQISLPYKREKRHAGESKYPLGKILAFALSGILSFSIKPLRLASYFGFVCSFFAFLMCLYALFLKLFTEQTIEGWTSIVLAILFIGGVQLLCLGILGEYVGRIYTHAKGRPLYIVDGYYGYEKSSPRMTRSPIEKVK